MNATLPSWLPRAWMPFLRLGAASNPAVCPLPLHVSASFGGPPTPPPQPELFKVLWDVAQPLYALEGAPLNPARAAADIATALGADGVVCAEPGPAGWWIGATVPTTRLGSVAIPAAGSPGVAVASAADLAGRKCQP